MEMDPMRQITVAVLSLISLLILTGCSSSSPQAAKKPTIQIGILPFEPRAGVQPGEAESVTELLTASIQQTGQFIVVERKTMNALMQERSFQASQDEDAKMALAGKTLAIQKMLSGSIGRLGSKYVFHLKMVDLQSSSVDLALSQTYDDDLGDIGNDFIPEIVSQLVKAVEGPTKK
jgi:TolB-like protein